VSGLAIGARTRRALEPFSDSLCRQFTILHKYGFLSRFDASDALSESARASTRAANGL